MGRTTSRTTGRATSCTTTHDTCRATQRCSQNQRLLLSHRAVGPADVQRLMYTYGDRGPAPGACSRSHEPIAAGDRTSIAGAKRPLDWTRRSPARAAPPDCADWCRRSRAGQTRVGTGRRRRLLRPEPWRAGSKTRRCSEWAVCTGDYDR